MGVLMVPVRVLKVINDWVLALGKGLAAAALAVMVVFILTQVFYRYVLNNALPWPDEAARFMMLWMTGLAAPAAYRFGGFVAIDMLENALPLRAARVLALVLFSLSLVVLIYALQIGWSEVTGFSGKFKSASLWSPLTIDWPNGFPGVPVFETEWTKIPRKWMMASLFLGIVLLIVVCIELMLRLVISLMGREADLPPLRGDVVGAD